MSYALLSLPSCGTDWVAYAISHAHPELNYYREFFQPLWNFRFYDELSSEWGCEMYGTVANLARPIHLRDRARLNNIRQITWCRTNHRFTKEVFSAFLADFFFDHFQCFILYRDPRMCFPPNRIRIYAWYSAMFNSLVMNRVSIRMPLRDVVDFAIAHARTPQEVCLAAHHVYFYQLCFAASQRQSLLYTAARPKLTFLDYGELTTRDHSSLVEYLQSRLPVSFNPEAIAAQLIATRQQDRINRNPQYAADWEHAWQLADSLHSNFPLPLISDEAHV